VFQFRTREPSGEPTRFSFVYGSCMEIGLPWPLHSLDVLTTWKRLHDPLFVLLLGDIVYADLPFAVPFERAYRKLLDDSHYSKLFKSVSRYAIYDDHEIANNWDRGTDVPLYRDAMEAYDAFIGSANPQEQPIHQIKLEERKRHYNFTVGNAGFFVLDERQYRSPNDQVDGPNKTLLGKQQKEKLKTWLLDTNSTLMFRFIASPGMFASVGGPSDGWRFFEREREELFNFMEDHHMRGIFLLSGDVHWAGAFEHRRGLFEFTTSPIHTFPLFTEALQEEESTSKRGRTGGVRTIFSHTWTFHYALVEVDTQAVPPFMQHTTYGYLLDSTRPLPIHAMRFLLDDVQLAPPLQEHNPEDELKEEEESKLIHICIDDTCYV